METLIALYPYLKAAHIIAMIAWLAGLFYLPRLFVYHVETEPKGYKPKCHPSDMAGTIVKTHYDPSNAGNFSPWIFIADDSRTGGFWAGLDLGETYLRRPTGRVSFFPSCAKKTIGTKYPSLFGANLSALKRNSHDFADNHRFNGDFAAVLTKNQQKPTKTT